MNNTENRFMHDGVLYVASNYVLRHKRTGCVGEYDASLCGKLPPCSNASRKDDRDVIFIESDVDNQGGEE